MMRLFPSSLILVEVVCLQVCLVHDVVKTRMISMCVSMDEDEVRRGLLV